MFVVKVPCQLQPIAWTRLDSSGATVVEVQDSVEFWQAPILHRRLCLTQRTLVSSVAFSRQLVLCGQTRIWTRIWPHIWQADSQWVPRCAELTTQGTSVA